MFPLSAFPHQFTIAMTKAPGKLKDQLIIFQDWRSGIGGCQPVLLSHELIGNITCHLSNATSVFSWKQLNYRVPAGSDGGRAMRLCMSCQKLSSCNTEVACLKHFSVHKCNKRNERSVNPRWCWYLTTSAISSFALLMWMWCDRYIDILFLRIWDVQ